MSEPASPGVPESAAERHSALSPEAVAAALGELHHWLSALPVAPDGSPPALPTGGLDLATLLREFTALRQEINLQTKSSRAQLEQNAELVRQARELLDSIQVVVGPAAGNNRSRQEMREKAANKGMRAPATGVKFFDKREYEDDVTEFSYGIPQLLKQMNTALTNANGPVNRFAKSGRVS